MIGIQSNEIEAVWDKVKPQLERAIEHADGKFTTQSVKRSLKKRDMQLWMDGESIGITRIDNYPEKKVCTVMFGAGEDLDVFKNGLEVIERWAKSKGCDSIEIWGRRGWLRVLDYTHIHDVIRKKL